MALEDIHPVQLKSRMLEGGTRSLRPINGYVVVERAPATRTFGLIVGVVNEASSFDVLLSTVLSISDSANVRTKKGPLKVGDKVLSVRVVNRRVDDIDSRTADGNRIAFLPGEHVLCRVDSDELLPTNDMILISAQPDRRMVGSIEVLGASSLEILSSEILSTGPDVKYGESGQYACHRKIDGVGLDSWEIVKKYGSSLKLIRQKSILGIADVELEPNPNGEQNTDYIAPVYKGL